MKSIKIISSNHESASESALLKERTSLPAYEDHGERMIISFMNEPRPAASDIDESFKVMADAGITVYMPWIYKKEYESVCERYGLTYIPHTEEKTPQEVSPYFMLSLHRTIKLIIQINIFL